MILFSALEADDCLAAYQWHRGFSAANDALFPRDQDDFESLVMEGSVWAAKSPSGDYLALAYSTYNEHTRECEIGGLMVAQQERSKGLGGTIMRLALGHALVEENLLDVGARVVAHVLEGNDDPRRLITDGLKFHHAKSVKIPEDELPGLRAREGFVHGDEFELTKPDSIVSLAEWARSWTGDLHGHATHVELRSGVQMHDWAEALEDLARRHR
jgi:GNAT superfamily N-acetyltransferase